MTFDMFDDPLKAVVRDWNTHELRLAVIIPAVGEPNAEGLRRSTYLIALVDGKGHQIVWAGDSLEQAVKAADEWEEDYMAVVSMGCAGHAYRAAQEWARKELAKDPFSDFGDDKEPA